MGKASKLKAFRRIAQELPGILTPELVTVRITGAEALEKGLLLTDGKTPKAGQMYKAKKEVNKAVDHAKIMKREYAKGGYTGVSKYLAAVKSFADQKASEQEAAQMEKAA